MQNLFPLLWHVSRWNLVALIVSLLISLFLFRWNNGGIRVTLRPREPVYDHPSLARSIHTPKGFITMISRAENDHGRAISVRPFFRATQWSNKPGEKWTDTTSGGQFFDSFFFFYRIGKREREWLSGMSVWDRVTKTIGGFQNLHLSTSAVNMEENWKHNIPNSAYN